MGLVEDFLSHYVREYDHFDATARICSELLRAELKANGVRCLVTYRAKSPDRLEAKLRQRDDEESYESIDEIYGDLADLSGVRVAVYFPGDRQKVAESVGRLCRVDKTKDFPKLEKVADEESSKNEGRAEGDIFASREKLFPGYCATHYRVFLREDQLGPDQQRYSQTRVEIQVASVLMHAWSEVEHDLGYKPLTGALSEDESSILAALNGLVLSGELGLEQLQRAIARRVTFEDEIKNHFDLASLLYQWTMEDEKRRRAARDMGPVDLLFSFMRRLKKGSVRGVQELLAGMGELSGDEPLVFQVVQSVLARDRSLREKYFEALLEARGRYFTTAGHRFRNTGGTKFFLSRWSGLEELCYAEAIRLKKIAEDDVVVPSEGLLRELGFGDSSELSRAEDARVRYDGLLRGEAFPNFAQLIAGGKAIEFLLNDLENHAGSDEQRTSVASVREGLPEVDINEA